MAPDISMTIPYVPENLHRKANLQSEVFQIVKQRGQFRNVDEKTLLSEIRAPVSDERETVEGVDQGVAKEPLQDKQDEVYAKMAEMHRSLANLQYQVAAITDAIATSVAQNSRVGESAMSPAARQTVPVGSIEAREVEPKKVSGKKARELRDLSTVVRAKAFSSASSKLSAASARLEAEAENQAKYWEQLASLRSDGWPVSRLQNDSRAIVVHFGSAESGPQYRNKGMAVLQQLESGGLTFPGRVGVHKRKRLSVTVSRHGRVTGRSSLRAERLPWENKLSQDLGVARDALFEEELFNEASREARLMASMGVQPRSTSIEVEISHNCSLTVSYGAEIVEADAASQKDSELAETIKANLRLMLVAEHQQKYHQRSEQEPVPMAPTLRPAHEYALLRPVVAQLRHYCRMAPLLSILQTYRECLTQAGLHMTVDENQQDQTSASDLDLQAMRHVVSSEVSIGLPTGVALNLVVETHLAAPRYGSQYSSGRYGGECGSNTLIPTSAFRDAAVFLEDVVSREVCTMILRSDQGDTPLQLGERYPLELLMAKGEDEPCATLRVSCSEGKKITVRFVSADGKVRRAGQWTKSGMRLLDGNGEHEENEQSVTAIVASWKSLIAI